MNNRGNWKRLWIVSIVLSIALMLLASCDFLFGPPEEEDRGSGSEIPVDAASGIDAFKNHEPVITTSYSEEVNYFEVNNNKPTFTDEEKTEEYFLELSDLDNLKRVGVAWGSFNADKLPNPDDERTNLDTEPTGWHQARYNGQWLLNRCHIIGYQISGLNDEPKNLMSGTRSFNVGDGMVQWENKVANHLKENDGAEGYPLHHIMYRVTPDFADNNLFAHGVYMEADCIECNEIDFNVYVMNREPGITIDYRTGENWANGEEPPVKDEITLEEATFILNINSETFHKLNCSRAPKPDSDSYELTDLSREDIIAEGYSPCGICKP